MLSVSITFIINLDLLLYLDFLNFLVFFLHLSSSAGLLIFLRDASVLIFDLDCGSVDVVAFLSLRDGGGAISSQYDKLREVHIYILSSDSGGIGHQGC